MLVAEELPGSVPVASGLSEAGRVAEALPLLPKEALADALAQELSEGEGEGEGESEEVAEEEAERVEVPEKVGRALSLGRALAQALALAETLSEGEAVTRAEAEGLGEALLLPVPPPPLPEVRLTFGDALALGLLVGEREDAVVRETETVPEEEAVPMAPEAEEVKLGTGVREGVLAEQLLAVGTAKVVALGEVD